MANVSKTFTYGDVTIDDVHALPPASLFAMISRGLKHYLGNEVASKVSAADKRHQDDKEGNPDGAPMSEEARAELKVNLVREAHEALLAGRVGIAIRGPAKDPLTAEAERIAKAQVTSVLTQNGIKVPKGDETVEGADGERFTLAQLIARRLAHDTHGPAIAKEAKRRVADKAKFDAQAKQAAAEGPKDVASLGL